MKKLSKLNLKNVTIISSNEMKHIIGGYDEPDAPGENDWTSEYDGSDDEKAKKNACSSKSLCDDCSWEGLTSHYGKCSQSPLVKHLFCASIKCFY